MMMEAYELYKSCLVMTDQMEYLPYDVQSRFYLGRAEVEWDLGIYQMARKHLLKALEFFVLEDESIQLYIQLSVKLDCFKLLFERLLEWDEVYSSMEQVSGEAKIVYKFYKWFKEKKKFYFTDKQMSNFSAMQRMIYYYLSAYTIDTANIQRGFIRKSLMYGFNFAAIKLLADAGLEDCVENVRSLYKMEPKYFKSALYKPVQRNCSNISVLPLGGGNNIGTSCYLVRIGEVSILLDCGCKIIGNTHHYPNFEKLKTICHSLDMIIISHAHFDHIGGLCKLHKAYPTTPIMLTKPTKELGLFNLRGGDINNEEELQGCLKEMIICEFETPYTLEKLGVRITLYPAGHILGAASVLIQSKDGNVFYTGDYCLHDQNTVSKMALPKNEIIDVLITETTYANTLEKYPGSYVSRQFKECISSAIKQGKHILAPAFAIGKAQELMSLLGEEGEKEGYRIYVDGSIKECTKIYESFINTSFANYPIYKVHQKKSEKEEFINQEFLSQAACVLASSGMLQEGSSSSRYAEHILGNPKGMCVLTGYQGANTLGRTLSEMMKKGQDAKKGTVHFNGKTIDVICDLWAFHFSAHGDVADILTVITGLQPQYTIFVHGEDGGEATLLEQCIGDKVPYIKAQNEQWIKFH